MSARLLAALLVLLLGTPGLAAAQIYRWTDDRGTVHYTEGMDSVPERYRAGAVELGRARSVVTPPAIAEKPTAAGTATIRFSPGQRIVLDARLNGKTTARLLLDTGADRTLIAPRVLVAAGVSLTRGTTPTQMRSVTGEAQASGVVLDSLAIGEARVGRLPIVAYDMNQPGLDGLLGRDFLDQFTVTMDAAQGMVTIAPK